MIPKAMPQNYISKVILLLTLAIIFTMNQETSAQKRRPAGAKTRVVEVKPASPEIGYTISMSKPWTHLLEVEMRLKWPQMPEKIELKMPVWTPGSYLIREYARQVQSLAVKDTSAIDLAWSKINKNTWQVSTAGAKEFIVT